MSVPKVFRACRIVGGHHQALVNKGVDTAARARLQCCMRSSEAWRGVCGNTFGTKGHPSRDCP